MCERNLTCTFIFYVIVSPNTSNIITERRISVAKPQLFYNYNLFCIEKLKTFLGLNFEF